MGFSFDSSDELKATVRVLAKKDKGTAEALNKKIKQIAGSDEATVEHYKNLRYGLKEYNIPLSGSAKHLQFEMTAVSSGFAASLQDMTLLYKQGKIR